MLCDVIADMGRGGFTICSCSVCCLSRRGVVWAGFFLDLCDE